MPRELLEAVDSLVGRRERSRFFADAAEREVRRRMLARAAARAGGSLEQADIPGWETSESAAEWVRASRRADQAQLDRLMQKA